MKKFLLILLAVAMMLTFVACGEGSDADKTDPTNDPATTNAPEETDKEFELGEVTGLKWENAFIGLGCTIPEGWAFSTQEELSVLNNVAGDYVADEYQDLVKNSAYFYDMHAKPSADTSSVSALLEKASQATINATNIELTYEQSAKIIKESYEQMGPTTFAHEIVDLTISGNKYPTLKIAANISGIDFYQYTLMVKCTGYIATINITASTPERLESLAASFYEVR